MTTTEQELNEKLASWVGFKRRDKSIYIWDCNDIPYVSLPDFTHDIAACLEHLGPKFEEWKIEKRLKLNTKIFMDYGVTLSWGYEDVFKSASTPALAFCRATEKAIELHIEEAKK